MDLVCTATTLFTDYAADPVFEHGIAWSSAGAPGTRRLGSKFIRTYGQIVFPDLPSGGHTDFEITASDGS